LEKIRGGAKEGNGKGRGRIGGEGRLKLEGKTAGRNERRESVKGSER